MYHAEDSHFWFVGKRLFIKKALSYISLPKKAKILDIGCGTGGTTAFLTSYGHVTGIEKNPIAASFARKRTLKTIEASANNIPIKNASFDAVTFFDVLYHKSMNEKKALREAFRLLKPGGYLLITDCAIPWMWSEHDVTMDAKYRYTKNQLETFVRQTGFLIKRSNYIFSSLFIFFLLSRMLSQTKASKSSIPHLNAVINTWFVYLLSIESIIFLHVPFFIGSSLCIIAQKPQS
jgi:ubiquinone/menaquinone biosynthesis C-methylase UbiE